MAKAFVASGNAVTTGLAAFATANQAESRIQQSAPICGPEKRLTKCPPNGPKCLTKPAPIRVFPGLALITKYLIWDGFRGFVLNAPRSSSTSR
jgi:hypothetical protein